MRNCALALLVRKSNDKVTRVGFYIFKLSEIKNEMEKKSFLGYCVVHDENQLLQHLLCPLRE